MEHFSSSWLAVWRGSLGRQKLTCHSCGWLQRARGGAGGGAGVETCCCQLCRRVTAVHVTVSPTRGLLLLPVLQTCNILKLISQCRYFATDNMQRKTKGRNAVKISLDNRVNFFETLKLLGRVPSLSLYCSQITPFFRCIENSLCTCVSQFVFC